jgi:hypothetical protein
LTNNSLYRLEEWISLASAALLLVTRREISLNRRLYAWFLGGTDDISPAWFDQHAKPVAIGAIKQLFAQREHAQYVATRLYHLQMMFVVF